MDAGTIDEFMEHVEAELRALKRSELEMAQRITKGQIYAAIEKIAPAHEKWRVYEPGEACTHQGSLYQCIKLHEAALDMPDEKCWKEITPFELFRSLWANKPDASEKIFVKGSNPQIAISDNQNRAFVTPTGIANVDDRGVSRFVEYPENCGTAALIENIAEPWQSQFNYESGYLVSYGKKMYMSLERHKSTNEFDASKWTDRCTVGAIMNALSNAMASAMDAIGQAADQAMRPGNIGSAGSVNVATTFGIEGETESAEMRRVFFRPEHLGMGDVRTVRIDMGSKVPDGIRAFLCVSDDSKNLESDGKVVVEGRMRQESSDSAIELDFMSDEGDAVPLKKGNLYFIAFDSDPHENWSVFTGGKRATISLLKLWSDACFCENGWCPKISFISSANPSSAQSKTIQASWDLSAGLKIPMPKSDGRVSDVCEARWTVVHPGSTQVYIDFSSETNEFIPMDGNDYWNMAKPNGTKVFLFRSLGHRLGIGAEGKVCMKRLWSVDASR